MIISQTPYRISLFGGGTDYPAWYREHGGCVLTTAINKYCYITCRVLPPFFEHKSRIVYSAIESVNSVAEIKHPAVKGVLSFLDVHDGLEIHHDGDLPARSGIGSSSSFTVGLIKAIYALKGQIISSYELARLAIHIEQNVIGETVGSQDQTAVAFGGINKIEFNTDDSITVKPVILHHKRRSALRNHMLLFFTGFQRTAETVAKSKVSNFKNKTKQLQTMAGFVDEAIGILQSPERDMLDIGRLLHQAWQIKRELSDKVTTGAIDDIYETGMKAGATGGKILGAGGGGFILFFAKPEYHAKIREKLQHLIEVSVGFDSVGSRISVYDPIIAGDDETPWRPLRSAP